MFVFTVSLHVPQSGKYLVCCCQLVGDHVEVVVCISVMEALKKKHKEELEREVEKVRRLSSGVLDSQTLRVQQQ